MLFGEFNDICCECYCDCLYCFVVVRFCFFLVTSFLSCVVFCGQIKSYFSVRNLCIHKTMTHYDCAQVSKKPNNSFSEYDINGEFLKSVIKTLVNKWRRKILRKLCFVEMSGLVVLLQL